MLELQENSNLLPSVKSSCLRVFDKTKQTYTFGFDYISMAGCNQETIPITINQALYMLDPSTKTATLYGPCKDNIKRSGTCKSVSTIEFDGNTYQVVAITDDMLRYHSHEKLEIHTTSDSPLVNLAFDGFEVVIEVE